MPAAGNPRSGRPAGRWWPPFLVVLMVAAAYFNALQAGFQFDDWDVIVRDPRVQDLRSWWASMPGMRPLLKLSYALNHVSGAGVVGFHAVNVVVHAANGMLIMALMRRFARETGRSPEVADWLGLATALVFVLHPVQTEAVTYASGRSTSLSALFALTSVLLWVQWRSSPETRRWRPALSLVSMVAAVATKETMVVVPAVLLLWEVADTRRPFAWREALRRTGLHWLLLAALLAALLALPRYREFLDTSLATRSIPANLFAQLEALRYLVGQLFDIDGMNADPGLLVSSAVGPVDILTLLALIVAAGLSLANLRRAPLPAFAVLWFLLWLAPTNSLLARLDLVNDRQLYVALAGPALLLAAAIQRLAVRDKALGAVAFITVLALTGLATHLRNEVYRDEVGFWRDVVSRSPHNARAYNNLGMALAARCDLRRAEAAWVRALTLDPDYMRAGVNLRLLQEGVLPAGAGPCPRPPAHDKITE